MEQYARAHDTVFELIPRDGTGHPQLLPRAVMDWAGLESTSPELTYRGNLKSISDLNDGELVAARDDIGRKPLTFTKMAGMIRRQL